MWHFPPQNWADAQIRFPLDLNQARVLSQDPDRFKVRRESVVQRLLRLLLLPLEWLVRACIVLSLHWECLIKNSLMMYSKGGRRGSPWFPGTKHNTCKPHSCGTLFLQGPSLSHPRQPLPSRPNPSFPRSMSSHHIEQNQRYHLGSSFVYECVRLL